MTYLAGSASILSVNGTLIAEVVGFLFMLFVIWRWILPPVMRAAEARQRQVAEQLEAAQRDREQAEQRLKDAEAQLAQARGQANEILAGASRSGEQLRADVRQRAEEDAHRIVENARKDIEAERRKAIDSVRGEVADLVVVATEKVIGQSMDGPQHRRLIEQAIEQVGAPGGNGARRSR